MSLIALIIAGAIIGFIARFLMKDSGSIDLVWTIVLGILGVLAGYYVAGALGVKHTNGIDWIRWIISLVAACVFIGIFVGVRGRRSRR